jgi:hypothetical protein
MAGALRRAARARGLRLTEVPGEPDSPPSLADARNPGVRIALPPDGTLARSIADDAVRRILRAWPSAGGSATVLLSPAATVCGPADHGPVDALVLGDTWTVRENGAEGTARIVSAQQTRCWLAVHNCEPLPSAAEPSGRDVEVLPAWLATDTARICEYMLDRGWADDWPQLLVAGPVQHYPASQAQAVFAFTEAGFAAALIDAAAGEGNRT